MKILLLTVFIFLSSLYLSAQLAGLALSQVNKGNQTSVKVEKIASSVLDNLNSGKTSKQITGSVLSQSNK